MLLGMTENDQVAKRLILWRDIHQAVQVWQPHSAVMNFEVLDVVGVGTDGAATVRFWEQDSAASMPGTEDPGGAEVVASAFVRFDGCSHWAFRDDTMLHLCGRGDLESFTTMQRRLFDEAERLIGASWCG